MIVLDSKKQHKFYTVAFSGDACFVAAGGDTEPTVIWETGTGRESRRVEPGPRSIRQFLVFHPRTPWLFLPTSYGLHAVNAETGAVREVWSRDDYVRSVALDSVGRRLVGSREPREAPPFEQSGLACTDVAAPDHPKNLWRRPDVDPPNEGWSNLVTFHPDGTRFFSAETSFSAMRSDGARISVRSAETGEALSYLRGAGTDTEQLVVTPDGETLVTRITRKLYVFDLSNPDAAPREFANEGRAHFTGLAFHPSGRFLAATSNDKTVKLYDTTTWQVAKTFTWAIGKIRSVAFSPDGTLAAAGSDTGKVVVWDVDL